MMLNAGAKWIILLAGLSFVVVGGSQRTQSQSQQQSERTLVVCLQGCAFTKIQQAIETAGSGDTVQVQSGHYQENLVIRKNLILEGISRDRVTLEPADTLVPLILVQDAQALIKGFTFLGGPGGRQKGDNVGVRAIQVIGISQVRILNNRIIGPHDGTSIEATGPAQVNIDGNEIRDSSFGIIIGAGTNYLDERGQALIFDNEIFGNSEYGIMGSDLLAKDNQIHDNGGGLSVWQARLWRNKIFANKHMGVEAFGAGVELIANEIFKNEDGVMLFGGYLFASENKVSDNQRWGFALWSRECGYENGTRKPSDVLVEGIVNEVVRNGSGRLCPSTSPPWPSNFYTPR